MCCPVFTLKTTKQTNQPTNQPTSSPPWLAPIESGVLLPNSSLAGSGLCEGSPRCALILCQKFGGTSVVASIRQLYSNDESGPHILCRTRKQKQSRKDCYFLAQAILMLHFPRGVLQWNSHTRRPWICWASPVWSRWMMCDSSWWNSMKLQQVELRSFVKKLQLSIGTLNSLAGPRYSAQTATENTHKCSLMIMPLLWEICKIHQNTLSPIFWTKRSVATLVFHRRVVGTLWCDVPEILKVSFSFPRWWIGGASFLLEHQEGKYQMLRKKQCILELEGLLKSKSC